MDRGPQPDDTTVAFAIDAAVHEAESRISVSKTDIGIGLRGIPATQLDDVDALLEARSQPKLPPDVRVSLDRHLRAHFTEALTKRATHLLHENQPEMSARSPTARWLRISLTAVCIVAAIGFAVAPIITFTALLYALIPYCVASMAMKATLTITSLSKRSIPAVHSHDTPIVTILLPVHNEGPTLAALVTALEKLDYPKSKLDLKFLVEANDQATHRTLSALALPDYFEVITVPKSHPQTKPKAMNYALPFVRGEVVGIYDAEDMPEPDQVRKAISALAAADDRTVCVQARLNHYKATETFISRMASTEYALWFDILLNGLSRLGLPVPLGGTSLFIRTDALRAIDGWDPNNVTEDADLGVRLARRGWRAEVIDSTTWEEPPVKVAQWMGQRSRWIKGFMVTWLVHMRDPHALVRDLGWRNALAINIMLLDGFVAFLLQPLFWIAIGAAIFAGSAPWSGLLNPSLATATVATFALGQMFILVAAFTAVKRRFGVRRALWSPFLWVYWQLATPAAYRALFEMFGRKSDWRKTEHGLSKAAQERQLHAMQTR